MPPAAAVEMPTTSAKPRCGAGDQETTVEKSDSDSGGGKEQEKRGKTPNADAEAMPWHHVSFCRVLRSSPHTYCTEFIAQPRLPLLSEPRRQPRHLLHDQQGLPQGRP